MASDLKSLLSNLPGAVFEHHLDAHGRDSVTYISGGCEEIWELPPESITTDAGPFWAQVVEEDRDGMAASVRRSAETMCEWSWRWRIVTPSGRRKWLEGKGRPRRAADGGVTWSSVILDVTDRVAVEEELAKSREMLARMQKSEAIGNLTAGVAHDFNNLLAVVLGNLELAADAAKPAEIRTFLEEAISAVVRGRDLTLGLLQFARRARLSPQLLDVDGAIEQIEPLLRRTLPAHVDLRVALAGGLPTVRLDRASLEGAVLNLVTNARDAMPDGGSLTVETGETGLSDERASALDEAPPAGRYVTVSVSDTGPGVPPDLRERIFEPFFTTKSAGQGTGLGLSTVLGFVRQSGGVMRLFSEMGVGSTFRMMFPVESVATTGDEAGRPGPRILLVEDDPMVRRMLARRLVADGYEVVEAADGPSALSAHRTAGPFALILTDVVMPGQPQGPELVRRLRDIDPNLKALIMSGYPDAAATRGAGAPSGEHYLPKPIARDALREALERILGRV
jgi:signal transduction histidine kinase